LAAALLLPGLFVVLPDEGSAATKRTTSSISLNFSKIEFDYILISDPQTSPPSNIANLNFGTPSAQSGPRSVPGPALPTASAVEVLALDSAGVASAASQDVFFTGEAASFPELSSFHLTMDFTLPGSTARGSAGALQVINDPADPSTLDRSYWQANVDMAMPGAVEYSYAFIIEANPDQPGLSLNSVQVVQAPMYTPVASSFFDVFVELNFDGSSFIDPAKPLLWVTTTAVPEPASLSLLVVGGAVLLRRNRCHRISR